MKTIKYLPLVFLCLIARPRDGLAIGQEKYVESVPSQDSFSIAQSGAAAALYVDANDFAGVARAVNDLQSDITRVTGLTPKIAHEIENLGSNVILIGTVGKSSIIDRLIQERKIDAAQIKGQWESFLIQTVSEPIPGVENSLVIAGSDKRGTIYGIYDLSEQIGVSPWYWWADVPVQHQDALFVKAGTYVQGPPAVKYRGIFLNDEAPALSGWVHENFGDFNSEFYTKVFELILRMKGNFLWPAMWNNSFATDDPLNPKLADECGIVMSTSHHEPMMRAWKEWERAGNPRGSWDYSKNAEALREYWTEGLRRTKDYEKIITLAMRGDGDEPMSREASVALLEKIVADQRKLIADIINPDVTEVPQVWALYKEVQEYYEKGMRVPDDVTLLWCDDNWGHIRRLPTPEERKRSGGAGIYYHFDYVGGPRNYKWLNTNPIPKVWEQMNLAWRYGANRIWIVNVGDLKPMEFPIEFFLNLAWNPERWNRENLSEYTRLWAEREFGAEHAADVADIISKYSKYSGRRKPELLAPDTFSLVNYREADRVLADWKSITAKAESMYSSLPENMRDAFFQLVLHQPKALTIVNELYITAGRNRLYAEQGRASANDLAARVEELFQADADLTDYYNHTLADGKWNHMMDQTHIGYTYWQQPPRNRMPRVREIELPVEAGMGVAIEGSTKAWPGAKEEPVLPEMDAFNRQRRYIDVFNKGQTPFEFSAAGDKPWITLSSTQGAIEKERRLWVNVDWSRVPEGASEGAIKINGADADPVIVKLRAFNPESPTRDSLSGFVEANGYVSIEAAHFTNRIDAGPVGWKEIEDYGRTLSAMSIFPVNAESVTPPKNSPRLEYRMYLFHPGKVEVEALIAPTLNFVPGRGLRFAVSFDDEPPRIVTAVPEGFNADNGNRDWEETVRDSIRSVTSTHTLDQPGYHTVKIWMVDPAVVLEKIVVNTGGLRPSYLGPPESYHASDPAQ